MILGEFMFHNSDLIFQLNDRHFGWLANIYKRKEYKDHYYKLSAEDKERYFVFLDGIIRNMEFDRNYPIEGHRVRDMGFNRMYLNKRRQIEGGRVRSRTRKTRSRKEKSRSRKTRTKKSRH